MKIDLGALAKGYSADLIATYLRGKGNQECLDRSWRKYPNRRSTPC